MRLFDVSRRRSERDAAKRSTHRRYLLVGRSAVAFGDPGPSKWRHVKRRQVGRREEEQEQCQTNNPLRTERACDLLEAGEQTSG